MEKKKFSFKFPERLLNIPNDPEILVYSAYLKTMGIDQDLKLGDWYYQKDEEGSYEPKLHYKNNVEDTKDFELATSGGFIRLISFEEALDALKSFNYFLSEDSMQIEENDEDATTTLNIVNPALDICFKATSTSLHAATLKALYLASAVYKSNTEANSDLEDSFKNED